MRIAEVLSLSIRVTAIVLITRAIAQFATVTSMFYFSTDAGTDLKRMIPFLVNILVIGIVSMILIRKADAFASAVMPITQQEREIQFGRIDPGWFAAVFLGFGMYLVISRCLGLIGSVVFYASTQMDKEALSRPFWSGQLISLIGVCIGVYFVKSSAKWGARVYAWQNEGENSPSDDLAD